MGAVDAAADAPLANATATGTGTAFATATQASTGPGTASGTASVSRTATATASGRPDTGSRATTSTSTVTSTASASAATVPVTSTDTTTDVGSPWSEIKVARKEGFRSCPAEGSAAEVVIKRSATGSLVLSGEAFRAAPGETTGCVGAYSETCFQQRVFPDTVLTPAQSEELDRLVAAMPPGKCTPKFGWDPCILTKFTIDSVSDTDWGPIACTESGGPGTHLAGLRAVVAYIDSLVPGNASARVDASAGFDGPAGDTARDATVYPTERSIGPCDIYADAKIPCVAAYSTIRALSKSYEGPLFQVRAGSSTHNNTMSGGTTKDIMPGPDGFVDASTVDEACGQGICTVSVLYDHSGNGNDLVRAPKGNTSGGATGALDNYESMATKGKVMAGGHQVYSLYMNKLEGYRTPVGVVGKSMPTGTQPQGIYMLADGTRKATGCCWEFGNVTSKPATEWAFVDALCFNSGAFSLSGSNTGVGEGPWYRADFGELWAGGGHNGGNGSPHAPNFISVDPIPLNNAENPSLDRARFALGFLKASTSEYAIRVADLLSADAEPLVTAWKGGMPVTVGHKGGIVLGVSADNSNTSWGTFREGAIVAGYPSDAVELSVMNNVKAVGYAPVP